MGWISILRRPMANASSTGIRWSSSLSTMYVERYEQAVELAAVDGGARRMSCRSG